MTVQELIRELQAMPNQNAPVRVVLSRVYMAMPHGDWHMNDLSIEDACEADDVRNEGQFVLVRSR